MVLTIEMLLSLGGTLLALAGFAWGLITWVLSQFSARDTKISAVEKDLAAHKLYAAEKFASKDEVAMALVEVKAAIERLADKLDGLILDKRA